MAEASKLNTSHQSRGLSLLPNNSFFFPQPLHSFLFFLISLFVFIHSCAFVCAFSDYGLAIVVKRHSGGSTIVVMRHGGDVGLIWWVSWADLVGFMG